MTTSYADTVGRTRIASRAPNLPQHTPDPQPSAPLFLYFAIQNKNLQWVGSRYFGLTNFQGKEGVSSPFEYQLELRALSNPKDSADNKPSPWPTIDATSTEDWSLDFNELVGRSATVGIARPSAAWVRPNQPKTYDGYHDAFLKSLQSPANPSPEVSLFNGVIASMSFAQPGCYKATLKPNLWMLTLGNQYRVWQGSIAQVIEKVLLAHGFTDGSKDVADSRGPQFSTKRIVGVGSSRIQGWLQAGESDYAFLQRLMGKANIYYYFEQGACGHTVVFSNQVPTRSLTGATGPSAASDPANSLRYAFTNTEPLSLTQEGLITDYHYEQSLSTSSVYTSFVKQPAVWETNGVAQYERATGQPSNQKPGNRDFQLNRIFPYTGAVADSKGEAQEEREQQLAMLGGGATKLSGSCNSPSFRVGHWFLMSEGERLKSEPSPIRPSLEGQQFVLTSVQHKASIDGSYSNSFEATELTGLLTPFNLQDTHQGSILAKVVDGASYRTPDFLPLHAFSFQKESQDYVVESTKTPMPGVMVKFCTNDDAVPAVWIKLSDVMPTAPQEGALVLVGRSRDFSELPEIQQVVDSHGSKVIMPLADKGLSWQKNTNIGSSYSTSYGDSQGVRYGAKSPGSKNIESATNFVKQAYNDPTQMFADGASKMIVQERLDAPKKGNAVDTGLNVVDQMGKDLMNKIQDACSFLADAESGTEALAKKAAELAKGGLVDTLSSHAGGVLTEIKTAATDPLGFLKSIASDVEKVGSLTATTVEKAAAKTETAQNASSDPQDPFDGGGLKDVSYSQGASCSYSESDAGADGVLSRSFSRGCSWSSNMAAWTKSYSVTGSKEARSGQVLKINNFDGVAQGNQSWLFGNSSSESVTHGDANSESTTMGATNQVSTTAGTSTNINTTLGASIAVNTVLGANVSVNTTVGASISVNTILGAKFEKTIFKGVDVTSKTNTEPVEESRTFELSYTTTESALAARIDKKSVKGILTKIRSVTGDATETESVGGVRTHSLNVTGNASNSLTYGGALTRGQNVTGEATETLTYEGALTREQNVTGEASETLTYEGALTREQNVTGEATETLTYEGALTRETNVTGEATETRTYEGAYLPTTTVTGDLTCSMTVTGGAEITNSYAGERTLTETITGASTQTLNFLGESTVTRTASEENTTLTVGSGICTISDMRPSTRTNGPITQTSELVTFL